MPYFTFQEKRIYYRESGSGRLLTLLTGNTGSSALHDREIAYFAKKYRVISPDYIGYGKSERIDRFPIDFWWKNADMVINLIHRIEGEEVIVVGTSGGGMIALNMAILAPNLIKAVVADSFVGEFLDPGWVELLVKDRELKTDSQRSFWEIAHGKDWEEIVEKDSLMLMEVAEEGGSVFKKRLNEILCPVLLTGSLSDHLIPNIERGMSDVSRQIPSSKIVFYPNGAHPLMWSKATEFRREVISFLGRLET